MHFYEFRYRNTIFCYFIHFWGFFFLLRSLSIYCNSSLRCYICTTLCFLHLTKSKTSFLPINSNYSRVFLEILCKVARNSSLGNDIGGYYLSLHQRWRFDFWVCASQQSLFGSQSVLDHVNTRVISVMCIQTRVYTKPPENQNNSLGLVSCVVSHLGQQELKFQKTNRGANIKVMRFVFFRGKTTVFSVVLMKWEQMNNDTFLNGKKNHSQIKNTV